MEFDWYKKYKKLAREKWHKEFNLWKMMYLGMIDCVKKMAINRGTEEEEFNPFSKLFLNFFLEVPKARISGKPIIMYPFNYGPELFHAMGLQPLMQEIFSVGLAPFHLNEPYLDITNEIEYGDNPTLCNAQRPLIGSYFKKVAPIPDLLFYLATPCNSLATTYQVFHHLSKVPTYSIDIPYWNYLDKNSEFYDEETLNYVIKQLKSLILWIEKETNHKLERDKFQQTMIWLNQCREYIMEFHELLRAVPCPVKSMVPFGNFLITVTKGGTKEAVDATKYIQDTALENVKNKI